MKNIKKRAFIIGVAGQDGSYLAELLLKKGYRVYGLTRSLKSDSITNLNPKIKSKIKLFIGDLTDTNLLKKILAEVLPDEIYNFAAISDNATAIGNPELTMEINALAPLRLLETALGITPKAKIFLASSGQIFLKTTWPQNEKASFNFGSKNPYDIAKIKLHQDGTRVYRERGLFVCSGFLFNHESPRRGEQFVTRKITRTLSRIKLGLEKVLLIGNLDIKRDWGFAGDYVECAWRMLQEKNSDDYVIATHEPHTVREFVEESAKILGMDIAWQGKGVKEKGFDKKTGKMVVEIDPKYFQPLGKELSVGDYSKAKKMLGWKPETKFKELVKIMTLSDLKNEERI